MNWQEVFEKFEDRRRPLLTPVSSAGCGLIVRLVLEEIRAELIETRSTHAQAGGGTGRVECAGVEILETTADEIGRQAMNAWFLCTPSSIGSIVCLRPSSTMGALPLTSGVFRIGPMGFLRRVSRPGVSRAATPRYQPLWQRPPLRLPSGRAVSCGRCPTLT